MEKKPGRMQKKRLPAESGKMNKRLIALVLAGCMVLAAGCGKKETKTDYSQYCTLGEYKGLTVSADAEQEVTEEEVQEHVVEFQKAYADQVDVTDRPVQEGDVVSIDYKGYLDGEAFDGGEGSYDLEIGSGAFIDGFEDGLIGAVVGETRDVTATFPEVYQNNPDMAGKEVVFTVTVNAIKAYDLPEFNDELVSANTDFATADEYREYVRTSLESDYKQQAQTSFRTVIMSKIEENCEFKSYPEDKVEEFTQYWKDYMEMIANYIGYETVDDFLTAQSMTTEDYEEWVKGMAEESCKQYLMYNLIGEKEGIEVTDDEIDAALTEDADAAGMDGETYLSTYELSREDYRFELLSSKVLDFLMENNTVTAE